MRLLVDTSILIDHLRGVTGAVDLLTDAVAAGDELWSTTVVRTEVLAGMRTGEEPSTHKLLDALRWQQVTVEIADRAGELARRYMKAYPGVDTIDYLVAATAEDRGAQLRTLNVKHFPMFSDLVPAY